MTFKEVARILRPQGKFFILDPIPNEEDSERFNLHENLIVLN